MGESRVLVREFCMRGFGWGFCMRKLGGRKGEGTDGTTVAAGYQAICLLRGCAKQQGAKLPLHPAFAQETRIQTNPNTHLCECCVLQ